MAVWVDRLKKSLDSSMAQTSDAITYALATYDAAAGPSSRFVVHRGFVNERRPREPIEWSRNTIETPFTTNMVVTTDIRSPKVQQILTSPYVSLSWWMSPTMMQFRIRAKAYILSPPGFSSPDSTSFPAQSLQPSPGFDWEQERLRHWRKLTPELRASFLRPAPGSAVTGDPNQWLAEMPHDLEVSSDRHKELNKIALSRFALIVLEPHEVDVCELVEHPHKRTVYKLSEGEWTSSDAVP
ncbi:hypothetical protein ACM66B_001279 [Microbotryomycetes sp. NB124-2]